MEKTNNEISKVWSLKHKYKGKMTLRPLITLFPKIRIIPKVLVLSLLKQGWVRMEEQIKTKVEEGIESLKKAKESIFSLYGHETISTSQIEHIDRAISNLRFLKEVDQK